MVQIPNNLESIIVGILLSDGHLKKNKIGNTLFSFKESIKRFEFFWIVFLRFSHFCQGYPILDRTRFNGKSYSLLYFATRVFPCFTPIWAWHNLFYVNNKK